MSHSESPFTITAQRLKALPKKPGVYIMRDSAEEILYVGKAKELRARVRSYFSGADTRSTIPFLLERVVSVETLVTQDERQALILEADLIRRHKPKYNIRLKDDKANLLVRIDTSHAWPRIELVRRIKQDGARYIGPFTFSYELRALVDSLQRIVPLRTCSDSTLFNRVRPCLEYQIKRCCAPCCLEIDPAYYAGLVEQAISILLGDVAEVIVSLEEQRDKASEELRFEDAAMHRDRIELLKRLQQEQQQQIYGIASYDVFSVYQEGSNVELCVLIVRDGRLCESKSFGFPDVALPVEELLSSAITQFYTGATQIAPSVLLPFDIEDREVHEELLSQRRGRAVKVLVPQRGEKRRLLELAAVNAKENFEARFSEYDRTERILEAMRVDFKLSNAPRTVECMDVSHIQGSATVGAVVHFRECKPERTRYRTFHLSQEEPDDFASMFELVSRHLSRQAEEGQLPDLLIIDGGKAQLQQALKAQAALGLQQPDIIALAKKRGAQKKYRDLSRGGGKSERVFIPAVQEALVLPKRSEVTQFLERVRDETHRCAIGFHRKARKRGIIKSVLDDIPGVGEKRRLALIKAFGSVEGVKKASVEEICREAKVSEKLAKVIKKRLQSR